MFKHNDDDEISLSDARTRMRRLLGARPADVTTTCTEPGEHKDRRVVKGIRRAEDAASWRMTAEVRERIDKVQIDDPMPTPTRRDVLAAISDTLALCRAVGASGSKDVAEIEIGLRAVFDEACRGPIVPASSLPQSRRLSERFESDVN